MSIRSICQSLLFCMGGLCAAMSATHAGQVRVAVAANFAKPFESLAAVFTANTGHTTLVSVGSTGKLYAQIKAGAPFDVLLAADEQTPSKLVDEGLAVKGSNLTYARGKLVLWSAKAGFVDTQGAVLKSNRFQHLALANPKLAPYGAAAMEALQKLGLKDRLAGNIVMGESIAQAAQFVATGNAQLGFVAMSQVQSLPVEQRGSWWVVPPRLYRPITQDAAWLTSAANNPAAQALLAFLKTSKAQALMHAYGYDTLP